MSNNNHEKRRCKLYAQIWKDDMDNCTLGSCPHFVYFIYFLPPRDNEMSEKENIYNKSLKFLDFFINIVYLFYLHLIYIVITIYIYNNIIKYYVMYKRSIEHQFSVSSSKYNQHSSVWPINRSYSSALYWTVGFNLSLIIVTIKSL